VLTIRTIERTLAVNGNPSLYQCSLTKIKGHHLLKNPPTYFVGELTRDKYVINTSPLIPTQQKFSESSKTNVIKDELVTKLVGPKSGIGHKTNQPKKTKHSNFDTHTYIHTYMYILMKCMQIQTIKHKICKFFSCI
jgi:hypothetical protein